MAHITDPVEHVHGVGSRVSWGAILAGAAIAFAAYFLLNLLGMAVGLSVSDTTERGTLSTAAAIWAILSVMLALFLGGWVTSRFTVGEDRLESVLNGAILWGVSFFLLLWLVSAGLSSGYGALVSASNRGAIAVQPGAPADATVATPRMTEEARQTAAEAAWWAFAGTILSMLAAIGGAVLGNPAGFSSGRRVDLAGTTRSTAPGAG